jgi:hypothetical protein
MLPDYLTDVLGVLFVQLVDTGRIGMPWRMAYSNHQHKACRPPCPDTLPPLSSVGWVPLPASWSRHNRLVRLEQAPLIARCVQSEGKKTSKYAVSLHYVYNNPARMQKTLEVIPAMEAGMSQHIWTLENLVRLLEQG